MIEKMKLNFYLFCSVDVLKGYVTVNGDSITNAVSF